MEETRRKDHHINLAFSLVLPLCVLGTGLATWAVSETTRALDEARFLSDARWTVESVRRRLNTYTALLHGGAGLLATSGHADARRFETYVRQLDIGVRYRGIQGIGYAQRVAASEVQALERRMKDELGTDFKVHPDVERAEYFPILYLQPMDARNRQALGYDMFSEFVRNEAMSRARDTGEMAASGKVVLVQEIDENQQAGFLIYYPVYRDGGIPQTVEDRRRDLLGFIYSPFRAGDLFTGVFSGQEQTLLYFEVYDGPAPELDQRLYASQATPPAKPRFARTLPLEIGGRSWSVHFESTPAFVANSYHPLVWSVFGTGLALSSVIVAITHSLSRARARAVRLQSASSRLAAIVESTSDAIISQDLNRIVTSWNRGAEQLMGYTADEMIGQVLDPLVPSDHADEDGKLLEEIRQGRSITNLETARVTKDGRRLEVLVTISPLRDESGRIVGASKIFQDITNRKRAERELHMAQAAIQAHAETLQAVVSERTAKLKETIRELEAFSYSLSHDMRTPLRSIRSYAQFVMADFGPILDPAAVEYLQKIIAAVRRMERLIADVLELTRMSRRDVRIEPVDVGKLVGGLIQEREELQLPRADVLVEGSLPVVLGNHASLEQCMSNLLGNAVKFVPRGVTPEVRVSGTAANGKVRIVVQDNGIGIPTEAQARVFEMFHRHHGGSGYEGTGLGLAIVKRAVERMSGRVGVESEVGKGSRFWVELPAPESGGDTANG